jgi:hypothetical protein
MYGIECLWPGSYAGSCHSAARFSTLGMSDRSRGMTSPCSTRPGMSVSVGKVRSKPVLPARTRGYMTSYDSKYVSVTLTPYFSSNSVMISAAMYSA